ncbi:MAG TPA: tetratricopeptide repeat protein [Gemmatimonadaceae bacterium]|nr:tetratricopeptide repeat protein [Gemmatimonadaceae bacterium]
MTTSARPSASLGAAYGPPAPAAEPAGPRRPGWLAPAALVALALAASLTGLANGFTFDDVPIVQDNARVHTLSRWWEIFAMPYWPAEHLGGLYRPLTTLGFALQWAAGGGRPVAFHAASILLYVAVTIAVWRLAALLLAREAAWVAAALFAVHPVHVEAVGNVVGQAEVLVALPMILGVALYIRARRAGPLRWRTVAALLGLHAVACLLKEHGILLPGLLLAAELTVVADARPASARARALLPLFAAMAAVGVLFIIVRSAVPTVLEAQRAVAPMADFGLGGRFLTMLQVLKEWARLLLWPAHLSADYSPQELEVVDRISLALVPSLVIAGALVALVIAVWRRAPVAALGVAWAAIMLVLVSNLVVPAGILLAERTLFMPSVGVVLALGAGYAAAERRARDAGPAARGAGVALLAGLLVAGVWRSADRQRVWRDNPTLFAQTVLDAPLSYNAHRLLAIELFRVHKDAQAEREMRVAMLLFDRDPVLFEDLAARYQLAGMCQHAVPLYEKAIALDPRRRKPRGYLADCLIQLGRFEEAAAAARAGLALPRKDARFDVLLRAASESLAARGRAP